MNDFTAEDDNDYNVFWQKVTLKFGEDIGAGNDNEIVLPDDLHIADFKGDGVADEITIWDNTTGTITLDGTTASTADIIRFDTGGIPATANGQIVVFMFPVISDGDPDPLTDTYYFNSHDGNNDILPEDGVEITFVDPGPKALQLVDFEERLAGNDDSSDDEGEAYPAPGATSPPTLALYKALPELIEDGAGAATFVKAEDYSAAAAPNGLWHTGLPQGLIRDADAKDDDTYYYVYASKDSTLAHVTSSTAGVIPMVKYDISNSQIISGVLYEVNEADTGLNKFAVGNLPEGDWYFYITCPLTSDFPLARSDKLTVTHWPHIDVIAWDMDKNSKITGADDVDIYLDSGTYKDLTGAGYGSAGQDYINIYFKVDDYDNNADVNLFYSNNPNLTVDDIGKSGSEGSYYVTSLDGGNAKEIGTGFKENEENTTGYIVYMLNLDDYDETNYITADTYYLYAVGCDSTNFHITVFTGSTGTVSPVTPTKTFDILHSPELDPDALTEYDGGDGITFDPTGDADITIVTGRTDVIMISWGKGGTTGDKDMDDEATIEFYIDYAGAAVVTDWGHDDAQDIRDDADLAAGDTPIGTHRIKADLLEETEGKTDQWYAWNLREDYETTGWYPYDEAHALPAAPHFYHLYGIITDGVTERVVALGVSDVLDVGDNADDIEFANIRPYANIVDPPAKGITIDPNKNYELKFEAFDIDAEATAGLEDDNVGIFIVKKGTKAGTFTAGDSLAIVDSGNTGNSGNALEDCAAGKVYCLTSADGSVTGAGAAPDWLEQSDTSFTIILDTPVGSATYAEDINGNANPLSNGEYWVYIGCDDTDDDFDDDDSIVYRSPGKLKIEDVSQSQLQKNMMMEPRSFIATEGDISTVEIRIADGDAGLVYDHVKVTVNIPKQYFDVVTTDDEPITWVEPNSVKLENKLDGDATNWIIKGEVYEESGIDFDAADFGTILGTYQVVCKGFDGTNELDVVLSFDSDASKTFVEFGGSKLGFTPANAVATLVPRGQIAGKVEFDDRVTHDNIVTFMLRERGSYNACDDATYIVSNDGRIMGETSWLDAAAYAADGVQYKLDTDGRFILYDVPAGDWELWVGYDRYLARVADVDVAPGGDETDIFYAKLYGGDSFGYTDENGHVFPNNAVTQEDYENVTDAFGDTQGSATWDDGVHNYKWADINEDDIVYTEDVTITSSTWQDVGGGAAVLGDQPVFLKPTSEPNNLSNLAASVEMIGFPDEIKSGETYSIQIMIHGATDVKGYYVDMDYDKEFMSVASITKGDFITEESFSFERARDGKIGLVNTVYGREYSFSGDGVLAEVLFTANRDGALSPDILTLTTAHVVNSRYVGEFLTIDNLTSVDGGEVPVAYNLNQNFPNPFNPTTTISFSIPKSSNVELKVYNILGRQVKTLVSGAYDAGNYSVVWDATDTNGNLVSNGVYFYTIRAADYSLTRKMLFMK